MTEEIRRFENIYSRFVLLDSFRYKDLFQIYPPEVIEEDREYPDRNAMYLEYKFISKPFLSEFGEELWAIDIFENRRFKEYCEKTSGEVDFTKGSEKAFYDCVELIRTKNIIREILIVLNLFLSHHIWFEDTHILPKKVDGFGNIHSRKENFIPSTKYYKPDLRYAIDTTIGEDQTTLFLPKSLENSFNRYFSLNNERKIRFFSASHYFYQAELAFNLSPGVRYLLFACAIDALTPSKISPGKRFKGYINNFSGHYDWNEEELNFLDQLWDNRNDPAHGDIVRYDIFRNCCFYAGSLDFVPDYEALRSIAQIVCLNWLMTDDNKLKIIEKGI